MTFSYLVYQITTMDQVLTWFFRFFWFLGWSSGAGALGGGAGCRDLLLHLQPGLPGPGYYGPYHVVVCCTPGVATQCGKYYNVPKHVNNCRVALLNVVASRPAKVRLAAGGGQALTYSWPYHTGSEMDILSGLKSLLARKPGKENVLNGHGIIHEKMYFLCLFHCNVCLNWWVNIELFEFKPWQFIFV